MQILMRPCDKGLVRVYHMAGHIPTIDYYDKQKVFYQKLFGGWCRTDAGARGVQFVQVWIALG